LQPPGTMSWEDDDFEVQAATRSAPKPLVNAWDDEEEDTSAPVTESWEDFDKPKEKPEAPEPPAEKKTYTQVSSKKKRGKALAEKTRQREAANDEEGTPQKLTHEQKRELEEQIKASDLDNTKDIFGVKNSALKDSDILFGNDVADSETKAETTLNDFKPKNEKEFLQLAEMVNKKVEPFSGSAFFPVFLKAFLKHTTTNLEVKDVKDLIANLNVIANDKIKAESAKKGKKGAKKKAPTKATPVVFDDMVDDEYDMFAA